MYPLPDAAFRAIRQSHGFAVKVDVWGLVLDAPGDPGYRDANNKTYHYAQTLGRNGKPRSGPVIDGEVTVDMSSRIRRTLSMSTVATDEMWNALTPYGVELRVQYGIRLSTGYIQWCPVGVFGVDVTNISYGPEGTISITAPDRWVHVQRSDFENVRQTSGNAVRSIIDLVLEAFTPDGTTTIVPPFNIV